MALLDSEESERIKAAAAADIAAPRGEFLFKPPSALVAALCGLLQDKRDAPILYLLFNICCTTIPAAAWLFWLRPTSNLPGLVYMVANYVLFLQRFMLMLHFSEHRRLFKKGAAACFVSDCAATGTQCHPWCLPGGPPTYLAQILFLRPLVARLWFLLVPLNWPAFVTCTFQTPAGYEALNYVAPLLLCPLFGVPSGMYRLHHCVMHHVVRPRSRLLEFWAIVQFCGCRCNQ